MMLNPEYHSYIDENCYNTLLVFYVKDMIDDANNYHDATESSATGSSE